MGIEIKLLFLLHESAALDTLPATGAEDGSNLSVDFGAETRGLGRSPPRLEPGRRLAEQKSTHA